MAEPRQEEPLDPSRVIPYRRWSDPAIDNDLRLSTPLVPGQDPAASLWVAGLLSRTPEPQQDLGEASPGSWLEGLVNKDTSNSPSPVADSETDRQEGDSEFRTWDSDLEHYERPQPRSAETTSWLAGLVKQESRPAFNDFARLLLGDSVARPAASPAAPTQDPFPSAPAGPEPPNDPFLSFTKEADSQVEAFPPPPLKAAVAPPLTALQPPRDLPKPVAAPALEPKAAPRVVPSPVFKVPEINLLQPPPKRPGRTIDDAPAPPVPSASPESANEQSSAQPAARRRLFGGISARQKVSFYTSLNTMFEASVPLFAIFEFMAREGENTAVSQICRRIGQSLVAGHPLHVAAAREPDLFDLKAVRMMEVGYKGGNLPTILGRLAVDEERNWQLREMLRSQLAYPCCIAAITLTAVLFLPPIALTPLLEQISAMTAEPPMLTRALLAFSAFISSPWTIGSGLLLGLLAAWALSTPRGRTLIDNAELTVWFVPGLGSLWRNLVGLRFLRVFSMTYESGLAATTGIELAASASGSLLAYSVYPLMKRTLIDGGSLTDAFGAGGFLPALALEGIRAGEESGRVPDMLENSASILAAEVESRIDTVAKMVEPLVLGIMGAFVALFVLGCILPIVELTENL